MKGCICDLYVFPRFMQLFSANSPLGNFNYSHGLESAVKFGWVTSISEFVSWQKEIMYGQLLYLDLPMIKRFYYCLQGEDKKSFIYYLQELLSFRDSYELRLEEQDRGKVIVKLMLELGWFLDPSWKKILEQSMLASISWIGFFWKIPLEMLCLGYAYSSLESNIISALKLVPFGQFVAQKLLIDLSNLLPVILDRSFFVKDGELGGSFPLLGIASLYHEVQDSRLFRS